MSQRWKIILDRLLQPNWLMLSVALATLALLVVPSLTLSVQGLREVLRIYPGYDKLNENYYLFDTMSAYQESPPGKDAFTVAIIGGSTTRESLTSAADLTHRLSHQLKRPVHVIDWATSGQNLSTSLYLAERAGCNGTDMAVVGVSLARLGRPHTGQEQIDAIKGFGIPWLTPEQLSKPERDAIERRFVAASVFLMAKYALQAVTFIQTEGVRSKVVSVSDRHAFLSRRPLSDKQVAAKLRRSLTTHPPGYRRFGQEGLERIAATAQAIKKCGGRLVLFDTPVNPLLMQGAEYQVYADGYQAYLSGIKALARAVNLTFLTVNDGTMLPADAFHDFGHLRTRAAIAAATDVLAHDLAKAIETGG